jgi:hypothetical protein
VITVYITIILYSHFLRLRPVELFGVYHNKTVFSLSDSDQWNCLHQHCSSSSSSVVVLPHPAIVKLLCYHKQSSLPFLTYMPKSLNFH